MHGIGSYRIIYTVAESVNLDLDIVSLTCKIAQCSFMYAGIVWNWGAHAACAPIGSTSMTLVFDTVPFILPRCCS